MIVCDNAMKMQTCKGELREKEKGNNVVEQMHTKRDRQNNSKRKRKRKTTSDDVKSQLSTQ